MWITLTAGRYRLDPALAGTDLARFQAALEAAAAQSHRALAATLTELDELFVQQRQRLPELAGELVSPSAQWRYLADRLPLGASWVQPWRYGRWRR